MLQKWLKLIYLCGLNFSAKVESIEIADDDTGSKIRGAVNISFSKGEGEWRPSIFWGENWEITLDSQANRLAFSFYLFISNVFHFDFYRLTTIKNHEKIVHKSKNLHNARFNFLLNRKGSTHKKKREKEYSTSIKESKKRRKNFTTNKFFLKGLPF